MPPSTLCGSAAILLLACITLLFSMIHAQTDADVLVIGAGVAGIKAAFDLSGKGIKFTVLEARARPLGRIDTRREADWPIPIELGAQWFHGDSSSNEVLAYAKSLTPQTPTVVTPEDDGIVFNGAAVVDDKTDASWESLYNTFEGSWLRSYRKQRGAAAISTPLSDAVNAYITNKGLTGLTAQGFLAKINTYIVQEYGASTSRLNLKLFDDDTEYNGEDSVPTTGYSSVFASMLAAINANLMLNTEVTKITYSASAAIPFRVETSKGVFTARFIICTLPLGVLQAKLNTLLPGSSATSSWLSPAAVKAIRGLGMGTLNKVVMQFPSAFWDAKSYSQSWIDRIATDPKQPVEFFSLFKATGQPVLVAFYAGDAAVSAESMSDSETLGQATVALQGMFGSSYQAPLRYMITRWTQDPYALGSYSYVKVGADAKDARWQLGQAEAKKRFWFAGEAADETYPSTVQGAWRSGKKAAAALAAVYKPVQG